MADNPKEEPTSTPEEDTQQEQLTEQERERVEEFLEEPLEDPEEIPEEDVEETPEETPEEESEETPEEKPETPTGEEKAFTQADLDDVVEKMRAAQQESMADEFEALGARLRGEDPEAAKEDPLPWEKEGRATPTIREFRDYMLGEVQKYREQEVEKEQQQTEEQKKQQEQLVEQYNTYWDNQYSELAERGLVPAVEETDSKEDEGVQTKTKILKKMYDLEQAALKEGKQPTYNLKEVFYDYQDELSGKKQPAGADAPVAGSTKRLGTEDKDDSYSYEDIHNTPIEELVEK